MRNVVRLLNLYLSFIADKFTFVFISKDIGDDIVVSSRYRKVAQLECSIHGDLYTIASNEFVLYGI